jgi:5-methylcytosine-specific restriction endonuclease McrA
MARPKKYTKEELKLRKSARYKTEESKAERREYHRTPQYKEYMRQYLQSPERKAIDKKRQASSERKKQMSEYRKKNKGHINHLVKLYVLDKLKRTPKWADLMKIKEIYKNCPEGMTVDHIIPLRGENISGLHVENNLQYLTRSENSRKGNSFDLHYNTE